MLVHYREKEWEVCLRFCYSSSSTSRVQVVHFDSPSNRVLNFIRSILRSTYNHVQEETAKFNYWPSIARRDFCWSTRVNPPPSIHHQYSQLSPSQNNGEGGVKAQAFLIELGKHASRPAKRMCTMRNQRITLLWCNKINSWSKRPFSVIIGATIKTRGDWHWTLVAGSAEMLKERRGWWALLLIVSSIDRPFTWLGVSGAGCRACTEDRDHHQQPRPVCG